jgi:hypothetical protein
MGPRSACRPSPEGPRLRAAPALPRRQWGPLHCRGPQQSPPPHRRSPTSSGPNHLSGRQRGVGQGRRHHRRRRVRIRQVRGSNLRAGTPASLMLFPLLLLAPCLGPGAHVVPSRQVSTAVNGQARAMLFPTTAALAGSLLGLPLVPRAPALPSTPMILVPAPPAPFAPQRPDDLLSVLRVRARRRRRHAPVPAGHDGPQPGRA